ncbi:MAG: outer membrane lipoprotein-sorting protein [Chthoniobacteraceae bacterium]
MAEKVIVTTMHRQVKARIISTVLALATGGLFTGVIAKAQDGQPDGAAILQRLRDNEMQQHRTLAGELRNGSKVSPFQLALNGGTILYQFTTPPPYTLVVHLGKNSSQLDEVTLDGKTHVNGTDFGTLVRGSDISFEDVAMRFLYWPEAKVLGEETKTLRKCWKVQVTPPKDVKTVYASVLVWIDEESGAMMEAQAYDAGGKLATAFKLIEPQMIGGVWLPKKIRIQRMKDGEPMDGSPTYLIIDKVLDK